MRLGLFCVFLLLNLQGFCQDYSWWDAKHNYLNDKPRLAYLKLSPEFMGPNALPVPYSTNGQLSKEISLQFSSQNHFRTGEFTTNTFIQLNLPVGNKAEFRAYIVPFELFWTDTTLRDERLSLDRSTSGFSGGDFYFESLFKLLSQEKHNWDAVLRIAVKTASGTDLEASRFTDTPGYYFDLGLGKKLNESSRLSVMLGFYAWQTYSTLQRQDDAFLYGLSYQKNLSNFLLTSSLEGYIGYINNGDRPMVLRLKAEQKNDKKFRLFLGFQKGLINFPYTSAELGFAYFPGFAGL